MKSSLLVSQVLNGLATGMLYALMGIGLSIITGVLNIPNFAHGALFALGAYSLYTVIQLVELLLTFDLSPIVTEGIIIVWRPLRSRFARTSGSPRRTSGSGGDRTGHRR